MWEILATWLYINITKELEMKQYFYLFIVVLIFGTFIGCDSQYNRGQRRNNQGVVVSPVHRNQTVQLRGRNMGNVQSIDLSVALPYDNTSSLMEYQGFTNIQGRIQLDSSFRCLGGSHAAFNCEAEVNSRVIEMANCNIRGNVFQIRVPFKHSESSTHQYDILSVFVESPECFFNRSQSPYRPDYRYR